MESSIAIVNSLPVSVAVRGSVIAAVGSTSDILQFVGKDAEVIDAKGRFLSPGFVDCHSHPLFGALSEFGPVAKLDRLDLDATCEVVVTAMKEFSASADCPKSGAIVGMGCPYVPLTRSMLDAVSTAVPVVVVSYDIHAMWANTVALSVSGLLHEVGDGNDDREFVQRDGDGVATGMVRELPGYSAIVPHMDLFGAAMCHRMLLFGLGDKRVVPADPGSPVRRELLALLKKALLFIASKGVTSVHVMDGDRTSVSLYDELDAAGELPVRVNIATTLSPTDGPFRDVMIADRKGAPGDMVRVGACKIWLDGVVETQTALMTFDYPGKPPGSRGKQLWTTEDFLAAVDEADKKGLRVVTHAVGDAAVRLALDTYEKVAEKNGPRDRRFQIEHLEITSAQDLPRFARAGVIASVQPLHATTSGEWIKWVPPSRYEDSFAWDNILKSGAMVVFGSDWPVVTPDVVMAMMELTKWRKVLPEAHDQRQSIDVALRGYTTSGAYAEFAEAVKGKLEIGQLADLVLMSEPMITSSSKPILTVCNGKITFRDQALLQ